VRDAGAQHRHGLLDSPRACLRSLRLGDPARVLAPVGAGEALEALPRVLRACERRGERLVRLDLARRLIAAQDDLDVIAELDARRGADLARGPEVGAAAVDREPRAQRDGADGARDRRTRAPKAARTSKGTSTQRPPPRSASATRARKRCSPAADIRVIVAPRKRRERPS
jgi:hypothetical protein